MNIAIAAGTFLVLAMVGSVISPSPSRGMSSGPDRFTLDLLYWTVVAHWPVLLVALVGALTAYLLATLLARRRAS